MGSKAPLRLMTRDCLSDPSAGENQLGQVVLTPAHTSKQTQKKKKQLLRSYSRKQDPQILGKLILFLMEIKSLLYLANDQ